MAIIVDLDVVLARRKISVAEFADAVLDAVCRVLDCQPGAVLRWVPDHESRPATEGVSRSA